MANITFQVNMTDGSQIEKVAQVSDENVSRIVGWAMAHYRKESSIDAINSWINDMVGTSLVNVLAYEQEQAAKTAREQVELISVTIE